MSLFSAQIRVMLTYLQHFADIDTDGKVRTTRPHCCCVRRTAFRPGFQSELPFSGR